MTENGIARAEIRGLRELIEEKFAHLEKQNNQQMRQLQQEIIDIRAEIKAERNAREEYEKLANIARDDNSKRLSKLERIAWLATGFFTIMLPIVGDLVIEFVKRII